MTRKDSEKESERPHYYSQFWLDVAAGRRIIGAPKPNEEADIESEAEPEPVALHRPARASSIASSDGYAETLAHPEVEPEFDADDFAEPELEELDANNELDEAELPLADVDEAEIPDVDFAVPESEEEEEEEELFDEEEEEDEDSGWTAGRGRKKPKPGRQVKPPKKAPKREPRRGF